jgi:hypothetical protein
MIAANFEGHTLFPLICKLNCFPIIMVKKQLYKLYSTHYCMAVIIATSQPVLQLMC